MISAMPGDMRDRPFCSRCSASVLLANQLKKSFNESVLTFMSFEVVPCKIIRPKRSKTFALVKLALLFWSNSFIPSIASEISCRFRVFPRPSPPGPPISNRPFSICWLLSNLSQSWFSVMNNHLEIFRVLWAVLKESTMGALLSATPRWPSGYTINIYSGLSRARLYA